MFQHEDDKWIRNIVVTDYQWYFSAIGKGRNSMDANPLSPKG